jgi:protein-L-isoaspartate(D-aspartate) O-methyltransferase
MIEDSARSGRGMTSRRTCERLAERLRAEGIHDERVLAAIRNVPRHLCVDEALASRAYEDIALSIGMGQTISQPYAVALMSQALLADGVPDKVLEIGTGSGYQTAILASLVSQVYSVVRIGLLAGRARELFPKLGIHSVRVRHDDGFEGWPEHAPFDGIVLTAALSEVPPRLLQQLAPGGRLIATVGADGAQELVSYTRRASGFERRRITGVSFVPMLQGVE